jgi:hypothetical protein
MQALHKFWDWVIDPDAGRYWRRALFSLLFAVCAVIGPAIVFYAVALVLFFSCVSGCGLPPWSTYVLVGVLNVVTIAALTAVIRAVILLGYAVRSLLRDDGTGEWRPHRRGMPVPVQSRVVAVRQVRRDSCGSEARSDQVR